MQRIIKIFVAASRNVFIGIMEVVGQARKIPVGSEQKTEKLKLYCGLSYEILFFLSHEISVIICPV